MHPYRPVNIFVYVKSRTRTVCAGGLHRYHFRFQDFCFRIEMGHSTRHFLFEPYFRVLVHIGRTDGCLRKSRGFIVFHSFRRYIIDEETVCLRYNQNCLFIHLFYLHNT